MFHRSEELDGLKAWNAADDDQGLLKEARSQHTLFLCEQHGSLSTNVMFQNNLLNFLLNRDGV